MSIIPRFVSRVLSTALMTSAIVTAALVSSELRAQSISIGLRGSGSLPTGDFAQTQVSSTPTSNDALIQGAKSGFGYGLDVGLGLGPIGLYGSFDHVQFDCATATCRSDGKYTLQGVTAGVKLLGPAMSILRPYVKGGVTLSDLKGGYGGQSSNALTTDKTPGYEIGLGVDVGLPSFGLVSLTPEVRYIGQNLKAKIPGIVAPAATGQGVNYLSFDLGLSVHTPFGR
jgi:outer membrane protein with beta-barrel domain